MRLIRMTLAIVLLAMSGTAAAAALPKHLQTGDRIVFYGDSITEQRLYTNYAETYLLLRYPDAKFTFFNAGWSGDAAPGGLERLKRDLLILKPTVVTICYGMNDGWYMKYTENTGNYYRNNMNGIIEALKENGVRVVLLTSGITDSAWLDQIGYNDTLRSMADVLLGIASAHELPAFDLHKLMTEVQAKGKARNPEYSVVEEELGIHPQESGQLLMAYALLKALGTPPRRDIVTAEKESDGTYRFKLDSLPYFVDSEALPILTHIPFADEFNDVRIKFPDLENCAYQVAFPGNNGAHVFSHRTIAAGLKLTSLRNSPPMRQAAYVAKFTDEKNDIYYALWRTLGMKGSFWIGASMNEDLHKTGIETSLKMERVRWKEARPPKDGYRIRLTPIRSARETVENGHFIEKWSSLGPIGNKEDDPIPDCRAFSKRPRQLGAEWRSIVLDTAKPKNNLGRMFSGTRNVYVYLYTIIDSPKQQPATILVGSDDRFTLWVNGTKTGESTEKHTIEADHNRLVGIRIKKGRNVLVAKITNGKKDFSFLLRFSELKNPVTSIPPTVEKLFAR